MCIRDRLPPVAPPPRIDPPRVRMADSPGAWLASVLGVGAVMAVLSRLRGRGGVQQPSKRQYNSLSTQSKVETEPSDDLDALIDDILQEQ
eukprot:1950315-Prymnesium_polylepis.1